MGRRAWRPEQLVKGGLLGGETVIETVRSRLSWVTGAVLGVPGEQVLWITVECAIDSKSSFVPCVHCEKNDKKKWLRVGLHNIGPYDSCDSCGQDCGIQS